MAAIKKKVYCDVAFMVINKDKRIVYNVILKEANSIVLQASILRR